MAITRRVHVIYYGDVPSPNNQAVANRIISGLRRLADALDRPDLVFVRGDNAEFPMEGTGAADTTYFSVNLVTMGEGFGSRNPSSQFNLGMLLHHVTLEDDL